MPLNHLGERVRNRSVDWACSGTCLAAPLGVYLRHIYPVVTTWRTAGAPIDVRKAPADYLSLGSQKFYGPKGFGALYLRRKVVKKSEASCGGVT